MTDLSLDQTLGGLRAIFEWFEHRTTEPNRVDAADAIQSALALLLQQQQADKVWTELTVILSCTSPDGSVELSMVRDLLDTREQQQQAIARLTQENDTWQHDTELITARIATVYGAAVLHLSEVPTIIAALLTDRQSLTSRLEAQAQEIATLKEKHDRAWQSYGKLLDSIPSDD